MLNSKKYDFVKKMIPISFINYMVYQNNNLCRHNDYMYFYSQLQQFHKIVLQNCLSPKIYVLLCSR